MARCRMKAMTYTTGSPSTTIIGAVGVAVMEESKQLYHRFCFNISVSYVAEHICENGRKRLHLKSATVVIAKDRYDTTI